MFALLPRSEHESENKPCSEISGIGECITEGTLADVTSRVMSTMFIFATDFYKTKTTKEKAGTNAIFFLLSKEKKRVYKSI